MQLDKMIYISGSIFIILGVVVAFWSFIDTYRIRSAKEFHQTREDKTKAANHRHEKKTRLGK